MTIEALENQLDSFNPQERLEALKQLMELSPPPDGTSENVNMHFHSFFSYNAEGWSPTRIAWEARKAGLYAAGLCDFDVLDGLDEFLQAGERLGLRTAVFLETRAYLAEFAEHDMNSPGEPGVTYIMGAGFPALPAEGTPQAEGLAAYRDGAAKRNVELIERINPHIPAIAVDYEVDVKPLTPAGAATERHIIRAYVNKAAAVFGTDESVAGFWAETLGKTKEEVFPMLGTPALDEAVRAKLAKRGGFGYVQPSEETFPPVGEFLQWVESCDAIPMATWLDGCSSGESDPEALLQCLKDKGAVAMNIIPDRNWNYTDPETRAIKVANLKAVVAAADKLKLPINIGTEMNKHGLPFVDDLGGEVLGEFKNTFLRGAQIMVGHTIAARFAGRSYAKCQCDVDRKIEIFSSVGALPPLTGVIAEKLQALENDTAFEKLKKCGAAGSWQPLG